MENKANYTFVGIFVCVSFAVLAFFLVWLASPRSAEDSDFYTVYFTDPISGLDEGTAVTYRGMDVGKVQSVRLDKDEVDLIKVDIAVDKKTPVRGNTRAELMTQGITGLTQLELSTSPDDRSTVKKMAGEKYPVLIGSPSKLSRILDSLTRFATEGAAAAGSVHKLSEQLRDNPSQIIFGKKKKKPQPADDPQ